MPNHAIKERLKGFNGPAKHLNRSFTKDASSSRQQFKVVFVLLENFSIAAFTSAVDVLATANLVSRSPMIECVHCSLSGQSVISDIGLEIRTEHSVEQTTLNDHDMLVICGGYRTPLKAQRGLQALLHSSAARQCWIGSLWNGVYQIAHAGLLHERSATAHPDNIALLTELFPKTEILHKPYVIDGAYFSCAGPNSAMQMMLDLTARLFGPEIRLSAEEILTCDTRLDADDNLITKSKHRALPAHLRAVIELMENNIEEPLTLAEIARYVDISRRQIERLFARYFDISPSRYYLELRLTKARQLLLQSDRSVAEVSVACGFLSSTHFSHSFRDIFGLSPTQMRSRFLSDWLKGA